LIMAFLLSIGISAVLAGHALLSQIEMIEWTNNSTSFSPAIKEKFAEKAGEADVLLIAGFVGLVAGIVFTIKAYNLIRK